MTWASSKILRPSAAHAFQAHFAFLSHMLNRSISIEEELIDQRFNSTEKRLTRALLLMARYGDVASRCALLRVSTS